MRETAAVLGHLPEDTTGFVGRDDELTLLDRALARHRLITLVGCGGVGKSRLALRAARRVREAFRDGVAWAELAPLQGARLLVATVSDACDLSDHTPRTPVDALCEWLADKQILLVLDSCEHLLAPCRDLVGDLLTVVPGLTVLSTGREPLDLHLERVIEVEPLPEDGPEARELLRQRMASARPEPGPYDPVTAARICRRLEGIPLALELAAGQAARTGTAAVAERLASRFEVLRADEGAVVRPERHRTMMTTIGWSHELCTPLERLLWARLTVFRSAFDEGSARAVCAGGPLPAERIGPLLDRLCAASVISAVKVSGGVGIRYRMLDTIREYGRIWLRELAEESPVADRHAGHFLGLAERADAAWLGPEQAHWYRVLDGAHTDLCTALDHLLTAAPGRALRLMGLIGFFWSCCGHLHEARDHLEQILAVHPGNGPDRTRALWALGVAVTLQGEYGTARRIGAACARSARRTGAVEGLLAAAYLRGLIALLTGRPLDADRIAAGALRSAVRDPFSSADGLRCHLVRVFALTGLGRLPEARERARWLRAGCAARGESWTRAYLDYQLSLIALFSGEPAEAAGHARAMLAGKQGIGDSL
ncbi:protein kinase/transcriptional regulator, partial [Streptomyces clavuligerus]